MPEIKINVGGRAYTVACQAGEESHLQSAAEHLDKEAETVLSSAGQVPEGQLLLMSGLMLADKMVSDGDREKYAEQQIEELQAKLRTSEERANALSRDLEAAANAPAASGGDEHALLEKMAVELERLADEMEATGS